MALQDEARRISLGQELDSALTQLKTSVANAKTAKARVTAVKNKMENEPSLYPVGDVTDVNQVLTDITTEVAKI